MVSQVPQAIPEGITDELKHVEMVFPILQPGYNRVEFPLDQMTSIAWLQSTGRASGHGRLVGLSWLKRRPFETKGVEEYSGRDW